MRRGRGVGLLPGLIGTIQATETVKILLGKGTTLSGRLLLYDAMNMRFRELKLRKDPAAKPIETLIDYEQFCGVPANDHETSTDGGETEGFERISVQVARQRLDEGWEPYVLDVRKPHEAQIATLAFADRLQPHEEVGAIAHELPTDRPILIYCKTGGRSGKASRTLTDMGFDVINLEGGIRAWAMEIDQSLPTY